MKRVAVICLLLILPFILVASNVVINEIMYNQTSGSRWIELYNNSENEVDLTGWRLQTAGVSFNDIYTFSHTKILPHSFLLIGETNVNNTDINATLHIPNSINYTNGLRVIAPDGYTDTIVYGFPNLFSLPDDSGMAATDFSIASSFNHSLARIIDGQDTDNCRLDWYSTSILSPRQRNIITVDLVLDNLRVINSIVTVDIGNPSPVHIAGDQVFLVVIINASEPEIIAIGDLLPYNTKSYEYSIVEVEDTYVSINISLEYSLDDNYDNNVLNKSILTGSSPLVFNELMFKQSLEHQEWIEIYNRGSETVVMNNFYIRDAANTYTYFSGSISSGEYLVICRYKEQFINSFPFVNPDSIIESISWAILNNTSESLALSNSDGVIFDEMEYNASASYPHNVSYERVNPHDDNSAWEKSIHPFGATPTLPNSILPLEYDIAITDAFYEINNDELIHKVELTNKGYKEPDDFIILCYRYDDEEEIGILVSQQSGYVSAEISFSTVIPEADYTTYQYIVESEQDMNVSNNEAFSFFNNNAKPLVINEIMYRNNSGEPIWLELIVNNRYKYLSHVILETERCLVEIVIDENDYILLVNKEEDAEYIISKYQLEGATVKTGLTGLYVSGEKLSIYDPSGNLIESFTYNPDWSKERGVSIERINPLLSPNETNWGHSVNPQGCTPGERNSIFTAIMPTKSSFYISPNPFSPYRGERTILHLELPEPMSIITCRIFDLKGRKVNTLVNQGNIPAISSIIWNGCRDDGIILPIGVYTILVEATGKANQKVYQQKKTVVIGR